MELKTYLENSSIISPMGWDSRENLNSVLQGRGGIKICKDRSLSPEDLPVALLDWDELGRRFLELCGIENPGHYTRFEKAGILSV